MAGHISIDIHDSGEGSVDCDGCGKPLDDLKIIDLDEGQIGYVVTNAWLFKIRFGSLIVHEKDSCVDKIKGRL